MKHPFLVAGIVLVSFIALAQPSHMQSYNGYGHMQSNKGYGPMQSYKGYGPMQSYKGYGPMQSSYKGYGHMQSSYKGYGHMRRNRACYASAERGDECDTNRRCAWNRRECPNYVGCHLICTDNPYKWCYGLSESNDCTDDTNQECHSDITGQLVCIDVEAPCDP